MTQTSIKHNIRWLLVCFALILSSFFVLLILVYSWVVEDNIFNRMLMSEAQHIEQTYQTQEVIIAPRYPFMTLHDSWDSLPESVQLQRLQSPDRIEFPIAGQGTIHIKTLQLGHQLWVLAANVTEYEVSRDYLPKLLPWFVASILFVCVIALLIAWYLSNSIVKPLQYVASTVKQHQGQKELRFDKPFSRNEIGYLASVIESDFNQLQQALQREADFTRDVSHELRTPVSVIKMIVEKLSQQQPLSEQALSRLQSNSAQLEQTIDILMALARAESVEKASFGLLESVQDSIINHPTLAELDESIKDIDIAPHYTINANKNLFRLLFNNVLDNVVHHASVVKLNIALSEDTLTISNPLKDELNHNIVLAGVKSAQSSGIGQGLHLIRRICECSGWKMSVIAKYPLFELSITFKSF